MLFFCDFSRAVPYVPGHYNLPPSSTFNAGASCTPATRPLAAAMRSASDEKYIAFVDFENTEAGQRIYAANQEAGDKAG